MTRLSEMPTRASREPQPDTDSFNLRYKVHMALAMIRASPRSVRTFASIAIATFGLLLSFAAINAMSSMMSQSARDIISGDVSAFADGYEYSMLNPESDVVYYVENSDRLINGLEKSQSVAAVRPRLTAGAQLSTKDHDSGVVVIGSDFEKEGYKILDGHAPVGSAEICINPTQRDELGVAVGDQVSLAVAGAPNASTSTSPTVVCVYDNSRFGLFRSTTVVMDLNGIRTILDRPESLTQVLVTLKPGEDASDTARSLEGRFTGVKFSTAEQTADLIFSIQAAQRGIMWALVLVTAIICSVLIGNIVGFALHRQRGEIATMRAMGLGSKDVRAIYAILTLIVGTAMVALGTAAAVISALIMSAIGIPIGGGEQLFGDRTLHPWLGWADVLLTATLMLSALVIANLASTKSLLKRSPIEMSRDA